MSENPIKEILGDLLPYFESLEAQSSAILQLLRDKHIANDEELNRYMEKAGDASSVKWRAARVRMEHLFAVLPDPTTTHKTEGHDQKEVRQTEDRSKDRSGTAETGKPGIVVAAEARNQPSVSQETRPSSEKESGKESKESPNDRPAETTASRPDSADAEKTKPTTKAEKDAA